MKFIPFISKILLAAICCFSIIITPRVEASERNTHTLHFDQLPKVWDEAIPLGNGLTGALIWEKDGKLRIAIDRADLWDLRPVKEFELPEYTFKFICDQVIDKKDITPVQKLIDYRTRYDSAPTKIPAGAIEFNISVLGEVVSVDLDLMTALCTIRWKNGANVRIFIPANEKGGRFLFENLPAEITPELIRPLYEENDKKLESQPGVNKLSSLGYQLGEIKPMNANTLLYRQPVWGDISYEIALQWNNTSPQTLEGEYSVTSNGTWYSENKSALEYIGKQPKENFHASYAQHEKWWISYWNKSSISIPDALIEKQWYLEMYKFAAASRKGAPPICLQAVWTADNGQTPPWRGDFHNDLNTQLSYWPGYASNHLEESSVFTDWLWKIKENSEQFTKKFFGVDGLNVSCICTLDGKPIGGWNQYSHSPSTSGWLVHHFYLQWKYGMDHNFLKKQAYPWVKDAARYFENIAIMGKDGKKKLPLSSSPEINDNRIEAWFQETTNYDLANVRLTYTVAAEMATALGLKKEAAHWNKQLEAWPGYAFNETGFMIAPDADLTISHRHFSHILAFHPFGLVDVSQGQQAREVIERSIEHIDKLGPRGWCGYSYAWMANMNARALDGNAAQKNLEIFSKAFCSPNSFHLNGDQLKAGYSGFTYRPFTLEGNFACASAIQEILLQSHTGVIHVFPAMPDQWKDASFNQFRAMGAFLVSAEYKNGEVASIVIESEKGGLMKLQNPFTGKVLEKKMKPGEVIEIKN